MGIANKPSDFTEDDAKLATVFGELAAIALMNSRFVEERQHAEDCLSKTVADLRHALLEVKILKGFIPICMYCKELRDDEGGASLKHILSNIQARNSVTAFALNSWKKDIQGTDKFSASQSPSPPGSKSRDQHSRRRLNNIPPSLHCKPALLSLAHP